MGFVLPIGGAGACSGVVHVVKSSLGRLLGCSTNARDGSVRISFGLLLACSAINSRDGSMRAFANIRSSLIGRFLDGREEDASLRLTIVV